MADAVGGSVKWDLSVDDSKLTSGLQRASANVKKVASDGDKSTQQLSSSLNRVNFGNFAQSASQSFNTVASGLGNVLKKLSLFGAGADVLGGVFTKSASDLQLTNTAFQSLIGNAEQANRVFGAIKQFADQTPFQFPELASSAQTLLGFGVDAQHVVGLLKQIGDVSGVTGGDIKGLTLAAGQIFAQGKVRAQEFYQIINSGAGALGPLIAKNLGEDGVGALQKRFQDGEVSATAFFQALQQATAQGGFAFQGTDKLAQTFQGRLSTLKDAVMEFGRNLLGVKVDPQLGLVVTPGGLFDQMSQLIPKITAALQAMVPILLAGFNFIINNSGTIISGILALSAAFVFAKAASLGFAIASFIALSPVVAIATALVAVITFLAIRLGILSSIQKSFSTGLNNLASSGKKSALNFSDLGKSVNSLAPGLNSASKASSDLAEKLADIDKQILKANRDFQEQLADMIKGHQDKVKSLEKQQADEDKAFNASNAERVANFKDSQDQMSSDHNQKIVDLQDQLNRELILNKNVNSSKVIDLQNSIAKENAEYERQKAEKQKTYDDDVLKAKTAHDVKTLEVTTQLEEEKALLDKHAADVASIRNVTMLDEIDKLKRSHDEQIAAFEDQKVKAIRSSGDAAAGVAANYNSIPSLIDTQKFTQFGADSGANFANGMKQAIVKGLQNFAGDMVASIIDFFDHIWRYLKGLPGALAKGTKGADLWDATGKHLPFSGMATGGPVTAGTPYVIGEQGPEFFVPNQSGTIIPNDVITSDGWGSNKTTNVSVAVNMSGIMARSRSDVREIGEDIVRAVNEGLRARRLPEIGGGAI